MSEHMTSDETETSSNIIITKVVAFRPRRRGGQGGQKESHAAYQDAATEKDAEMRSETDTHEVEYAT